MGGARFQGTIAHFLRRKSSLLCFLSVAIFSVAVGVPFILLKMEGTPSAMEVVGLPYDRTLSHKRTNTAASDLRSPGGAGLNPDLGAEWDGLIGEGRPVELRHGTAIPPSRTVAHAVRAKRTVGPKDGITLVTHSGVSKLRWLLPTIKRWNGPASVGVHLTSHEEIDAFLQFWLDNADILECTACHVLMESGDGASIDYPHNLLRNLALDNAVTDNVLLLDADYITMQNCHDKLWAFVQSNSQVQDLLSDKTLFVLPAFEQKKSSEALNLPESRNDVVNMFNRSLTGRKMTSHKLSHIASNYSAWLRNDIDPFYHIQYNVGFEPYVLACRHGLPRYWSNFRGFGFDKYTWFIEAYYKGYRLAVLRDFYIFHASHPESYKKRGASEYSELERRRFDDYIVETYGAMKADLSPHKISIEKVHAHNLLTPRQRQKRLQAYNRQKKRLQVQNK